MREAFQAGDGATGSLAKRFRARRSASGVAPYLLRALKSRRAHLALIALLLVPLFIAGARWGQVGNTDVVAANIASWQLATSGTLDLSEHTTIRDDLERLDSWYVQLPDGSIVSNRPPGLIGISLPVYAALQPEHFTVGPGSVVALLTAFGAVVITWHVLIGQVGLNKATLAALILGLGTSTWWISSAQLWPQGPGQLWAALAVLSVSSSAYLGAGWAFAASIATRPLTGLFAVFTGLFESHRLRSWKPSVRIAASSAVGVGVVMVYNSLVFGPWSVRGGYSEDFTIGAVDRFNVAEYLANVSEMFVGLPHGFLVTSPILGVALVGAVYARRQIPRWSISLALAGLGYLLLHAALNRASAGLAVLYRYPLEAIVLAAPLLTVGAAWLWSRGRRLRLVVVVSAVVSVLVQALNVFHPECSATPCLPHWF